MQEIRQACEDGLCKNKLHYSRIIKAGFDNPPGGEFGSANHVLNDHSYCCQFVPEMCAKGEPPVDKKDACMHWHWMRIARRSEDAQRLGVPFMLSEFGACLTEEACSQEIAQTTWVADRWLAGWAYWQFKLYEDLTTTASTGSQGFYNADGTLQEWKVKALSRTYLMATQGVPKAMEFDPVESLFAARYELDTEITQPTVIFASRKHHYKVGIELRIWAEGERLMPGAEGLEVDRDPENGRIFIKIDRPDLHKKSIEVRIQPAQKREKKPEKETEKSEPVNDEDFDDDQAMPVDEL